MIGRRRGRRGDGEDTVAKEGERGGGGMGVEGVGRGLWGVTALNYPIGLPSVGTPTRFFFVE